MIVKEKENIEKNPHTQTVFIAYTIRTKLIPGFGATCRNMDVGN
jgi:hypothetical protein